MARPLMKHNPAFLSEEELIRSFVVRHADLELLLERLREGGEGPNQHMLLIGPRGSGKTTLVLRVAAAVEAEPELRRRWYPLVFGEESYEVGTAAEFWLEAILHLAVQTRQARWRAIYDELKTQKDEKRLYEQALARLMDFADEQGKRLLIVAENLNMILGEQLSSDDGWVLRHTLQNEPRIMLLATATTRFDEIDSVEKAMYDLFWTHDLRPLDAEECRKLWTTITGQEISPGRIRPIQILTGGSPRLLAILATFASGLSFRELMDELAQLVDDHTSYFKSNLESLPVVERKVYVALADIWSPATARDVAAAVRIDVNKASALLHRLASRGAVTEVRQQKRRTSYQIAERMYNIYHLMRRRYDDDSRVRAVVDFMVHMYERDELVRATRAIAEEAFQLTPEEREDHFPAYAGIPDAESWSREAVTAEPDNLRFRFTLACLSGALAKWPPALAEAARFLADVAFARENMSDIIDFFIGAAVAGQAKEALACLTASPAKPQLEPLVVALQMVLDDDYNAPQEVVEVAKDVVERINARKQAPAAPPAPAKPERPKKRRPPSPREKALKRGGRG